MRALVIGGSGFTGRRVLAQAPNNVEVFATARSPRAHKTVYGLGANPIHADLDDPDSVKGAIASVDPDVVITVASLGFGHTPSLLACIEGCNVARAVFTSTTGIFTALNPPSKAVRLEAERAIQASALDFTIVRPTMIYGRPGDRNMERLLAFLRRISWVPTPGGGTAYQQPVHVDDLADVLWASGTGDAFSRDAFNVPGASALTFAGVVETAGAALGRRTRVINVPTKVLRTVIGAQERLLPSPLLKVEQIDRLREDKAFAPDDARGVLGRDLIAFDEGIRREVLLIQEAAEVQP